jgi:hypothetical protein
VASNRRDALEEQQVKEQQKRKDNSPDASRKLAFVARVNPVVEEAKPVKRGKGVSTPLARKQGADENRRTSRNSPDAAGSI